jgi:cold shock protein
MRIKGTVKFYDGKKGYGFYSRESGADVFFHIRELKRCGINPHIERGDQFEFDVVSVDDQRFKAENIRAVEV